MGKLFLHLGISAQSPVMIKSHFERWRPVCLSSSTVQAHLHLFMAKSFCWMALQVAGFCRSIFCHALQPCQLVISLKLRRERPSCLHQFRRFAHQIWRFELRESPAFSKSNFIWFTIDCKCFSHSMCDRCISHFRSLYQVTWQLSWFRTHRWPFRWAAVALREALSCIFFVEVDLNAMMSYPPVFPPHPPQR